MTGVTDERTESQSATEQVKERVQDVAGQAKGQTREQLRRSDQQRSTQAGEQVSSAAQALRRTSEQLRTEGKERAAKVVDGVADRSERLGSYLTRADGDRILRDVEDFARRQPWLFVGSGSAVVGFLASRFMKASSSGRYQSSSQQGGYPSRDIAGDSSAGYASPAALPSGDRRRRREDEARSSREVSPVASAEQTQRQDLHDQPIAELLKQLAHETSTLVRQELELAKAEMSEKGKKAGPGFGMIGAAGGVALLARGRADGVPDSRARRRDAELARRAIVAAVYGAVAASSTAEGKKRSRTPVRPRRDKQSRR